MGLNSNLINNTVRQQCSSSNPPSLQFSIGRAGLFTFNLWILNSSSVGMDSSHVWALDRDILFSFLTKPHPTFQNCLVRLWNHKFGRPRLVKLSIQIAVNIFADLYFTTILSLNCNIIPNFNVKGPIFVGPMPWLSPKYMPSVRAKRNPSTHFPCV